MMKHREFNLQNIPVHSDLGREIRRGFYRRETPMKITEATTLSELHAYRKELCDRRPMSGLPIISVFSANRNQVFVMISVPGLGTFGGNNGTLAEALDQAFTEVMAALQETKKGR